MAFQPVAATALVELLFSWGGKTVENTLYFRKDTDWDVTDLAGLSGGVIGWWSANLAPQTTTEISLVACKATSLAAVTGPQFINTTDLPVTGEVATDSVPNNVAFCISFRSALIGRGFRGRNYVPGLPKANFDGSLLAPTPVAALVTAYEALLSGLAGGTWVVVHRVSDHVVLLTGETVPIISVQAVDNVADSQRRRLPGRGT